MNIRKYRPEDVPAWTQLRREIWPDASPDIHSVEIRLMTEHPEDGTVFLLTDDEGEVVGFAEVSIRARVDGSMSEQVGYLEGWYVREQYRRRGWGTKLVREAEEWVRAKGFTELASDTELGNEGSIAAHNAAGFRETFRLVHFIKNLS